jgi:anti-anti-sigma factor
MKIERQAGHEGPVFKLVGRLEGGAARQLERMLSGPASDGGVVTVDLGGLESCDAHGVAVFVTLTNRARVACGALVLTSPSTETLQMFERAGALDTLTMPAPRTAGE